MDKQDKLTDHWLTRTCP